MTILFDPFISVKPIAPASFGLGVLAPSPEPIAKPRPYATTDAAWLTGFTAAMESEMSDVFPPADMNEVEAAAFLEGATAGYRNLDWEIEQSFMESGPAWTDEELEDLHADYVARHGARD